MEYLIFGIKQQASVYFGDLLLLLLIYINCVEIIMTIRKLPFRGWGYCY